MIIPLNIIRGYPVDGDFSKILRDLVQNFYDEIGYENFAKEFMYEWQEVDGFMNLSMRTKGYSFRYEWLTYVGGSTKTDSDKQYIGMYGEGFKMCMLCLLRDFRLQPRMSSQNWSIVPCWEWVTIGDTKEMTLAYDLTQRADDGETFLTIEKIPMEYLEIIKGGMLDFYYPENPLLGKQICSHEKYIIHERSDMRIPCAQWDNNLKGIYFEKSDVTTSYDYATYLERFSSYKENVGNISSENEYLDVPVQEYVNVDEEKMFPVLDTLASNCYRYEYAPNNVEYFWGALYTLISNNPDLGEYDSDGYGIVVERSMLEMYASGLFEEYTELFEIPDGYYVVEQINEEQYKFFPGDRGGDYSRIASWEDRNDGTYSVIVESVDEFEDEVYATYQFTLVENPYKVDGVEQVYPYSVRAVERLN